MADLYLHLHINTATSLRAGRTTWGELSVPLSGALLELLTENEREYLAQWISTSTDPDLRHSRLTVDSEDPADVAAALREDKRKADECKAKEAAEVTAREEAAREHAAWALAQPLEIWIDSRSLRSPGVNAYPHPEGYYSSHWPEYQTAYSAVPGVEDRREAARDECDRRIAEQRVLCEAAEAEASARKLAEAAAKQQERETWTAAHGSPRLRRLLAEGIEHRAVYRDERLALERPGWRWEANVIGNGDEPRNPPAEALELLDCARETAPAAKLVYWTVPACEGDHCDDEGWRGYACTSWLLGREIVFGGPEE